MVLQTQSMSNEIEHIPNISCFLFWFRWATIPVYTVDVCVCVFVFMTKTAGRQKKIGKQKTERVGDEQNVNDMDI